MHLDSLRIRNFKGIDNWVDIKLRPITVFIGANSSGKSSAIHALAALAQTFKLPNNTRPIVLDDEFADVHLGRFIEVIHSRKYNDSIGFSFLVRDVEFPQIGRTKSQFKGPQVVAIELSFKSTVRTQEIYLANAVFKIGSVSYCIRKSGKGYTLFIDDREVAKGLRAKGIFLDEASTWAIGSEMPELDVFPVMFAQHFVASLFQQIRYLGPFRQSPKRRYPTRGASPSEVGAEGEAAITMLANEAVQSKTRTHINEISRWLDVMGLGKTIEIQRVSRSDLFDANVTLSDGESFPIADLGYGMSQILPVLTQCSFAKAENILLFEQPELHLHTIPARQLARVFVDAVNSKRIKIVTETHSPEFFKQFITEIREGRLKREDFIAYRVSRSQKKSKFTELVVEDDCEIYDNWENGLSIG